MLTRAYLDAVLVGRLSGLLAAAGMDGATRDGTNPDTADPVAAALRRLGMPAADPLAPTDSDLASVPVYREREFLRLAEIRLRKTILAGLRVRVTQMVANDQVNLSEMATGLRQDILDLEAEARSEDGEAPRWIVVPLDPPTATAGTPGLPDSWEAC